MTDAPPPDVRPSWPTIGILIAIGAALLLWGVTTVDGYLQGAIGVLMLLIGVIMMMIRAVRVGMRE